VGGDWYSFLTRAAPITTLGRCPHEDAWSFATRAGEGMNGLNVSDDVF